MIFQRSSVSSSLRPPLYSGLEDKAGGEKKFRKDMKGPRGGKNKGVYKGKGKVYAYAYAYVYTIG